MASLAKKPASGKAAPSIQVGLLDILVSDRLRVLRPEVVDEIAESFGTLGQLQPIVLRQVKPSKICVANYVLVAGAHRLEAARGLGWKTIAAVSVDGVDAELAEIDENLIRADLSPAERKAHIGRRKEIYEAAHPETKHGAVGRGGKSSKDEISFVDDTGHKTGRGRSSVARDAKHAKTVAVLGEIPGTSLDSDSEIEALSKLPVQEQHDLAEQAKGGAEVTAKPAPAAASDLPISEDYSGLARMLRLLHIQVTDSGNDLERTVADVGTEMIREIIGRLKAAIEKHDAARALTSKADRAESGRETALGKDAIDAAEAKSKAPPADDYPNIPPFLDRRKTAEVDEEAAAIAAQAASEKRWLQ